MRITASVACCGKDLDSGDMVDVVTTLAASGRIRIEAVDEEIGRLRRLWGSAGSQDDHGLARLLGDRMQDIDSFDRAQLREVLKTCRKAKSLSEAGRMLFAASRKRRSSTNDADRLRKYLTRFDLTGGCRACLAMTRPSAAFDARPIYGSKRTMPRRLHALSLYAASSHPIVDQPVSSATRYTCR